MKRVLAKHPEYDSLPKLRRNFEGKLPDDWFFRPVALEIEMSQRCNLACPGCAIIEDVRRGFDGFRTRDILSLLGDASSTSIYTYSLTGGEPFTRFRDMCEIIENSPLDIFKIQTNGTGFARPRATRKRLMDLRAAGFGERNQYVVPSINCSMGMQTREGVPVDNMAILTAEFREVFGDSARLAINVTGHDESERTVIIAELERRYKKLTGHEYPFGEVRVQGMGMEYTDELAEAGLVDTTLVSLKERLGALGENHLCFNAEMESDDTPVPRIIVRADGTLYPCSCFGYVNSPGNISETPLFELLERINQDNLLKIVIRKGLRALFEELLESNPDLAETMIPGSFDDCRMCKTMREPEWYEQVRERLRLSALKVLTPK